MKNVFPKDDLAKKSDIQNQEDGTEKRFSDAAETATPFNIDVIDEEEKSETLVTTGDSETQSDKERTENKNESKEDEKNEPSKTEILRRKSSSEVGTEAKEEKSKTGKKRNSSLKRKILALEMELSLETIRNDANDGSVLPSERKKSGPEEEDSKSDTQSKQGYITTWMATLLIIGAATGSSFQTLPFHLREATWFGVFFVLLLGLNSMYAGLCVGWCLNIMEEVWPEYMEFSRIPYQEIGYRAVGSWMKHVVTVLLEITTLVMCGNYVILIAETLESLAYPHLPACYLLIIVVAALIPVMMLGSYRNMRYLGACDVTFSFLFAFLVFITFFYEHNQHGKRNYSSVVKPAMFKAFAGMSFAYGAGVVLPSIAVEMEDRSKFTEICVTAYMVILALYTVMAILGYAAYGEKTPEIITDLIMESENKYMRTMALVIGVIQAFQLATTFIIYFIPLTHTFEHLVNIPEKFTIYRVMSRTMILAFLLVVILAMPYIVRYIDLVAATSLNLLSFIFPPVFHIFLNRKQEVKSLKRKQSMKELILVAEIVLMGAIMAFITVFISVRNISQSAPKYFSCYFNMSLYPLREKEADVTT